MAKRVRKTKSKENGSPKKYQKFFTKKVIAISAIITIVLVLTLSIGAYFAFFIDNIKDRGQDDFLLIPSGSKKEQVINIIRSKGFLKNESTFFFTLMLLNYNEVIPGRYKIIPQMGNLRLAINIRNGRQEPVKVSFISTPTLDDLAEKITRNLEIDKEDLLETLKSSEMLDSLGMNEQTLMSLFIPNTYEFYWNTTPLHVIKKFKEEYDNFWNPNRLDLCRVIKLKPIEVTTLASIVQAESYRESERPRIAGVYMNRLAANDKLRADPTVIFAWNDYSIRRVRFKHLKIDSPYNTYKYLGLPPGPINCPSINAIDAVLNYEKHDYYFFCAKNDFSGYHVFTKTYEEHLQIAAQYGKAMDAAESNNSN